MKINLKKLHAQKIVGNHMEDYLCVGIFIMSMII
jgi:hypothetical protein